MQSIYSNLKRILARTPKRSMSFYGLLAGAGFFLFTPTFTYAILGGVAEGITRWIVMVIVSLITIVPALMFAVVSGVVNWFLGVVLYIGVLPDAFGTPPIVGVGWTFTRDFVNLFFLVILVFIGLALILRFREYGNMKTLANLVIIVLLINFSAVLVAVVVDIGNILTHYFLDRMGGFHTAPFQTITSIAYEQIDQMVDTSEDFNIIQFAIGAVAYAIALAIFFVFASFMMLAVGFIFFIRTVILWVIVILAPLAFAAYILPGTRRFWNQWFSALIQWAFVGVPIAFFMYLSNAVMGMDPTAIIPTPTPTFEEEALSDFTLVISAMLAPFTGLVLLLLGISISLTLAPQGARGAISWGNQWGRKATAVTAGFLGAKYIEGLRRDLAQSGWVQRQAERMEQTTSANAQSRVGRLAMRPIAPLTRWTGRKIGSENEAVLNAKTSQAETKGAKMDVETAASHLHGTTSLTEKLGIVLAKIKSGDIDDLREEYGAREFDNFVQGQLMPYAVRTNQHRDLEAAFPQFIPNLELERRAAATHLGLSQRQARHLTERDIAPLRGSGVLNIPRARQQAIGSIRPNRFPNVSGSMAQHAPSMAAFVRGGTRQQMGQLGQHPEADQFFAGIRNEIDRGRAIAATPIPPDTDPQVQEMVRRNPGVAPGQAQEAIARLRWLQANNPSLADYFRGTAAQGLL